MAVTTLGEGINGVKDIGGGGGGGGSEIKVEAPKLNANTSAPTLSKQNDTAGTGMAMGDGGVEDMDGECCGGKGGISPQDFGPPPVFDFDGLDSGRLDSGNLRMLDTETNVLGGPGALELISGGGVIKAFKWVSGINKASKAAKVGSSWVYGAFKSEAKWAGQLSKRGWTVEQITEAVSKGKSFNAVNMVNKANSATRYVHPTTGQSVVIDKVTKELLHVGGKGFKY